MKRKRRTVVCIDTDMAFLTGQKKALSNIKADDCFFGFTDLWEALHFIEKQIIARDEKLDYILLDEKIAGKQLTGTLEKFSGIKKFLKRPEIIVCTDQNSSNLRNQVMQFPFVSAFIVKPVPPDYIGFLITGCSA